MGDYEKFADLVYQHFGVDLKKYKRPQMERRLTALRSKRGYSTFQEYFQGIRSSNELLDEFMDRMTINVSEFYRNPNRWEVVQKKIIPECLKTRSKIKVWSAACSTGEEPYTLALIMQQLMPKTDISILATDIDEGALRKAKTGIYLNRSLESVPAQIKTQFFKSMNETQFELSPEIRKLVTFQKSNLLEDQFGSDFDLIVCRNVIIYFEEEAKDLLYRKFSASLRTGGVLFVGSTEQIFTPEKYHLRPYDTFFYQKL